MQCGHAGHFSESDIRSRFREHIEGHDPTLTGFIEVAHFIVQPDEGLAIGVLELFQLVLQVLGQAKDVPANESFYRTYYVDLGLPT